MTTLIIHLKKYVQKSHLQKITTTSTATKVKNTERKMRIHSAKATVQKRRKQSLNK